MKVRLLSAAVIALIGIPLVIFSDYVIFPIALGVLSLIAAWELLRVFGFHKKYTIAVPSYLTTLALPLLAYEPFLPKLGGVGGYLLIVALVILCYLLYLAFISVFAKGSLGYKNISAVFMSITYVSVAFSSLSLLRYMPMGSYYFALVLIGAWMCDSFAYFTGRLFGKHKLCPELSPKKTVEGAIGGSLFSIIGFLLYGFIIESFFPLDANYLVLAVSGLLVSAVAQMGDLFASLIKREYGVKDYSKMIPGHGGIMDRFDSILAVSAFVLIICIVFPPFTAI